MKQCIAFLLPNLRTGGAERVCLTLAYEMKAMGHEVHFILLRQEGSFVNEAARAFCVHSLSVTKIRQGFFPLRRVLRRIAPDLLIGNMWPLSSLAAFASIGQSIEVLGVEHGLLSAQYAKKGALHRSVLRTSLAVSLRLSNGIGVSKGVTNDLSELGWSDPKRVQSIHNPVPAPCKTTEKDSRRVEDLWSGHAGLRLITAGRLKPVKRHELMIESLVELPKELNAKLMIVGGGQCETVLRQYAEDRGVVDRVIFAGFHQNLTAFYKSSDIFLLSSKREGFGNVIVEAMACGNQIVSTDCPTGPREILADGKYGRLVSEPNAMAFANAIEAALSSPIDVEVLKSRACDFLPEKVTAKYLEFLKPAA